MDPIKIFVVEDDPVYAEMLTLHLSTNPDYDAEKFLCGNDLLDNLHRNPSIITLDYSLPDMTGLQVIRQIQEIDPDLPVIVISGQEDIKAAIGILKEGAYDYITKDKDTKERLSNIIKNLHEKILLKKELYDLKEEFGKKYEYENVIKGKSPVIKQVLNLLEKATRTNITTIITGESGTGKDLIAKAIHYNSVRKKKPFITFKISSVPKDQVEVELFGQEKGSGPGNNLRKVGKLEAAAKGTLFLDDICDMDMNTQSVLLRVLQDKEFTRLGGYDYIKTEFRLIVASTKNIAEEVRKGKFREDLYYRLLGLPIELPPLRYRGNDILILAKHFSDEFRRENDMKKINMTSAAQEKLLKYSYPGNVRELKAIMELACVMTNTNVIDDVDISFNSQANKHDFLMDECSLEEYTKRIIRFYLQKYNNNVLLVAKKLDVGKSTIYRMLKNKEI